MCRKKGDKKERRDPAMWQKPERGQGRLCGDLPNKKGRNARPGKAAGLRLRGIIFLPEGYLISPRRNILSEKGVTAPSL